MGYHQRKGGIHQLGTAEKCLRTNRWGVIRFGSIGQQIRRYGMKPAKIFILVALSMIVGFLGCSK